ncbi:hypothetical protein [Rubrivirga sp. IMCC45206]|uniref:hypothetical protein n=1 Tax=Rubrivirga sp. IMCC45206 TaxID=3391614 RepID=UPI00398FB3FF
MTTTQSSPGIDASASSVIASWPETSRAVAQTIIGKYGAPNEATPTRLTWFNSGPWKRTVVYRDTIPHNFPMPHPDLLEQFIDYQVPPDRFDDLAQYDGSVIAERTKGEISARCDKEGANFLAINLAHDVATGRRTVEEARQFYAQTMQAVMSGEMPAYTQGFQFQVPRGNTNDPDRPAPGM